MPRQTFEQDPWSWSDQRTRSTDDVPRWLVIVGVACGLTLTLLLLRYAIDLLGLVFVIVLVGFSIRMLTDWISDSDTVSAGSLAWVSVGLFGTALVALWLFGSSTARATRLEQRVPTFVLTAIGWAEDRGWGNRVLLPQPARSDGSGRAVARTSPGLPAARIVRGSEPRLPAPVRPEAPRRERSPSEGRPESPSGSTSTRPAVVALPCDTSTVLTASPRRMMAGDSVDLRAVVRCPNASSAPPDGRVIFWRETVVLGSAALRPDEGQSLAQLTTADLPPGTHQLSAQYLGTSQFRTSRSPAVEQVVVEP